MSDQPKGSDLHLSLKKSAASGAAAEPIDESAIEWSDDGDTFKLGRYQGIRLLRLNGDISDEISVLSRHLEPDASAEKPGLSINFGDAVLTSQVIGALVASNNKHSAAGGKLVLCNLSDQTRTILALCKLEPLFTIYPDEAPAIAKLRAM